MHESNENWLHRLADFLVRRRIALLVTAVIVTVPASFLANQLTFDQSIESLYADDDPYLRDYLESKRLFGGDEFLMVAYADADLLSAESLEALRRFSDRLSQVPGVRTQSTQNLADALGPREIPFLLRLLLRTRQDEMRELSRSVLVGEDDRTTAVVLRLQPEEETSIPRSETFATVRRIAAEHNPPAYVAGEPLQVHDMFRIVQSDGSLLFRVSLVLLGLVLLVLFRSLRWVVLALMVVVATILWTDAILVVSHMELSMVSSMLNSLVTIIAIATVTHVTLHFRAMRNEYGRADALRRTIVNLAPAIFWTCTTTAAGFAALLSSEITPIRSFGTMMSLATLMVMLTVATLLPAGILLGRFAADPGQAPAEAVLDRLLLRITAWVEHRPVAISTAAALTVGVAALGFRNLEVETDFSKNFRASSEIVRSLDFIETRLGGAGTWEVNFPAPGELTPEFLADVRNLADELRGLTDGGKRRLTKVISLTDVLDLVPTLPFSLQTLDAKLEQIAEFQPEFEPGLYNAGEGRMRLVLRARERQPSRTKLKLIEQVEQIADRTFPGAKATGTFVLLAHLIESLLRDQLISFALAAVSIGTLMTLAFRSLRIGLISLVPNLFPIVLLVGTIGWIGVPVNIGTAMIASVSIGLTVDASIHYLSGYRRNQRRGLAPADAIRETHKSVGRALVFATLALIVGFSVLTISRFIPLVYFGMLVSVAMFGGLIGNLVLLPLLLRWTEWPRTRSEVNGEWPVANGK